MKILVVGGGGREHAICAALKKSPKLTELHCAPGNGGISETAVCHDVKATDISGMVKLAREISADYVFVAPDDPLTLGMVDALEAAGISAFGPNKAAAIIEGSKVFSKGFMKRHGIPTAACETFTDAEEAVSYIKARDSYPAVIKCDGLALGKGVIIAESFAEAEEAVNSILLGGKFGNSGKEIVVEEYLDGSEVTVLAFADGKTVVPMLSSIDHKRAFDGDTGLNTGGMGVIAPAPYYTEETAKLCMETIFEPTVRGLAEENRRFKGCLYFGLMLMNSGEVRVIEYNCRFGDPETQALLPLLETDLIDIITAVIEGKLAELPIKWRAEHSACVVMASGGYPEKYQTGFEIRGLENVDGACVYHAGTKLSGGKYLTNGGRVLNFVAVNKSPALALENVYREIEKVSFEKGFYRSDIGTLYHAQRGTMCGTLHHGGTSAQCTTKK
ncbi:MAG: phosphoribosylamine--glycine ligase [Oscillospiraceae bacterium]|jgi:phosphoribosylamine--glycine ligase|nr:phosphoribosylamine--glycine ligase [Oscillospiraceae bacterium]